MTSDQTSPHHRPRAPRSAPPLRAFAALFAALALLTTMAPAEDAAHTTADIAGSWSGSIAVPSSPLEIEIELTAPDGDDGEWSGTITIPVQKIEDFELVGFAPSDATDDAGPGLRFSIADIPGDPTFDGTLSADGSELSGAFTQGGGELTFSLKRAGVAAEEMAARFADLDEIIPAALDEFDVPGVAIGVVKNGKVIFAKGYGWANVEEEIPVTTETLFSIGSSTKAFTTFVLATLADEGKFDWDEPIRTYLPEFAMEDDYATMHATTRDAVAHRTGLPRHDLMWYNSDKVDYNNVVPLLRHLKMNAEFRERFQYNNLMFMTAGKVASEIGGASWEDLVQARILDPLGMDRTHLSVTDASENPDSGLAIAYRYTDDEDDDEAETGDDTSEDADSSDEVDSDEGDEDEGPKYERTPYRDDRNVAPAGSIASCVDDMLKWVTLHLNDGEVDGEPIITKALLHELHTPVTVMPGRGREHGSIQAYALAWMVDDWRGHNRVNHGGAIDGFLSEVWFFPRDGVGLVVFTNIAGTGFTQLTARTVADRALGLETIDWLGDAAKEQDEAEEIEDEITGDLEEETRVMGTSPSHDLKDYAGEFAHPAYGTFSITHDAEREYPLEATYNRITVGLEHWHYDTFQGVAITEDKVFEKSQILFRTGIDGKIDSLSVTLEPNVDPIVFERQGDKSLADPEVLAGLAGAYAIGPQTMEFVVVRNELAVDIIGQPRYNLDPASDWTFKLRGLDGFSVRFDVGEDGIATGAKFIQPNGVFIATRTDLDGDDEAADDASGDNDSETADAEDESGDE